MKGRWSPVSAASQNSLAAKVASARAIREYTAPRVVFCVSVGHCFSVSDTLWCRCVFELGAIADIAPAATLDNPFFDRPEHVRWNIASVRLEDGDVTLVEI